MKTEFFGKTISGPFTIPSGIVSTTGPIIDYVMKNIPEIGVLTTKSIGLPPRDGYREPVLSQYAKGCFVNAVGLTNPGADKSVEVLGALHIPDDKFLLTSIFGADAEEFAQVARMLAPLSDGLELNLSCPHAKGYGMAIGQDPDLVAEIVRAVVAVTDIPVIAKLTPNTDKIGVIARAAVDAGAAGICAINTVGPGYHSAHGSPVLSNGLGGMSGKGVLPIGLKCVREIRDSVDVPIIGCGGVSSAEDVQAFTQAGANIVGVGSALVGMTSAAMGDYFTALSTDLTSNCDDAHQGEALVQYDVDMRFRPVTLVSNEKVCDDIAILRFDRKIDIQAGEFVFLWIPELGEKPFSALTDDPFALVVINLGQFTAALMDLAPGTKAYVRGPHGIPASPQSDAHMITVSGGTGLAAVYQVARDHVARGQQSGSTAKAEMFVGARSSDRLYFENECREFSDLHVATDDGSAGYHGLVTELLRDRLQQMSQVELAKLEFYNCGPEPMVHAAEKVQREFCSADKIFNAIDYHTKCGVGICGACGTPDGRRLCVDGPFIAAG
ncbi:MAG: tRNA-dihydrouridine synthase [Pseudomonadales bacterium]